MEKFDFSGWATKNDLQCSDGRIIRRDAFKHCDGKKVPLVWMHSHDNPSNVLGHAILENRKEGVYAYCFLNETEKAKDTKELLRHGDIESLSIHANGLKQTGANVLHGDIRELSIVLAGANIGALIENVSIQHGDESYVSADEGIIYTGDFISLYHSDDEDYDDKEDDDVEEEGGIKKMEEKTKEKLSHADSEKTVADVFNSMTEEQQTVVYALIGEALDGEDEEDEEDEGGNDEMKQNAFDKDIDNNNGCLTHADQENIIELAKNNTIGSFQNALSIYADENDLKHDALSSGFVQTGNGNVSTLFPEYAEVRPGAPELITNDQGWISKVLSRVHKSPISRIRTTQVDIRKIDSLKAKGYTKGKQKSQTGNFSLVRRTTDPQTVYVKSALHRDDIIDITDFDYVQYLYNIDKMMYNEELATAIMLGDGRDDGDEAKISHEHIRPIWLDDDLYAIHVDLDIEAVKNDLQGTNTGANFGVNFIRAEALVNTILHAREKYKGSGTPDLYCTPSELNTMLLARDMNGRRIYSSVAELASSLNVASINTAEQFADKTRTTGDGSKKKLLAILVNLADYSVGATKGGELTHFTQFDIDFNQQKSLLEGRSSGALTRVYSAIVIEEPITPPSGS